MNGNKVKVLRHTKILIDGLMKNFFFNIVSQNRDRF